MTMTTTNEARNTGMGTCRSRHHFLQTVTRFGIFCCENRFHHALMLVVSARQKRGTIVLVQLVVALLQFPAADANRASVVSCAKVLTMRNLLSTTNSPQSYSRSSHSMMRLLKRLLATVVLGSTDFGVANIVLVDSNNSKPMQCAMHNPSHDTC